ncbi:hypothetical protein K443DRAFT_8080 [Laccaria amethystina LaAM-08-1]|uniref:Uncharacterized protein n=1 Tax=Laccaria amethystina LaAM-08-1 TaxID=1095629 RepID=A0A0C9XV78_9AGAR|nr:hypothetical protein K443DRAFT_8080 [Laccaria amethystina LaAM-08-1]
MLGLYGIYRVHEKGMKFAGAEDAYSDGRCFTVELRIFPVRVRTAANVSQEFLGDEAFDRHRTEFAFIFIPANSFPMTEVHRGGLAGRVRVPTYLLHRVLTLTLTTAYAAGPTEIPTYSLAHPPKPTVNEKLTLPRGAFLSEPFSATATYLIPPTSQPQLPLYLLSAAEPDYLVNHFAVFLDYVDHWKGHSDATYAWPPRFTAF